MTTQLIVRASSPARLVQRFKDPESGQDVTDIGSLAIERVERYVALLDAGKLETTPAEATALRRRFVDLTGGERQAFGTDIKYRWDKTRGQLHNYSTEEVVTILKGALSSGYRLFDAAELYGTLDLLMLAARQLRIPPSEITIVYKIKPSAPEGGTKEAVTPSEEGVAKTEKLSDAATALGESVSGRLKATLETIPGDVKKVLMLHELAEDPGGKGLNEAALLAMVKAAGGTPSLGVSNVDVTALARLHEFAVRNGLRLEFVQNRFSPYVPDTEVREFCRAKRITYMGYGLFGAGSLGNCEAGFALPAVHLRALQDPRVLKLAEKLQKEGKVRSPSELLLAWASAKGVTTVVFSGSHADENFAAQTRRLDQPTVAELDRYFAFEQPPTQSRFADDQGVALLYAAVREGAAWHILDTLLADDDARRLVKRILEEIGKRHSKGSAPATDAPTSAETTPRDEAVASFVRNLMRFATHLQIMSDLDQYEGPWSVELPRAFAKAAEALGPEGSLDRLYEWSQANWMKVAGAREAKERLAETVATGLLETNLDKFTDFFGYLVVKNERTKLDAGHVALLRNGNVAPGAIYQAAFDEDQHYELVSVDRRANKAKLKPAKKPD